VLGLAAGAYEARLAVDGEPVEARRFRVGPACPAARADVQGWAGGVWAEAAPAGLRRLRAAWLAAAEDRGGTGPAGGAWVQRRTGGAPGGAGAVLWYSTALPAGAGVCGAGSGAVCQAGGGDADADADADAGQLGWCLRACSDGGPGAGAGGPWTCVAVAVVEAGGEGGTGTGTGMECLAGVARRDRAEVRGAPPGLV
jgi:hypothetical protein